MFFEFSYRTATKLYSWVALELYSRQFISVDTVQPHEANCPMCIFCAPVHILKSVAMRFNVQWPNPIVVGLDLFASQSSPKKLDSNHRTRFECDYAVDESGQRLHLSSQTAACRVLILILSVEQNRLLSRDWRCDKLQAPEMYSDHRLHLNSVASGFVAEQ